MMEDSTRKRLIALYHNRTRPRDDGGLPYSLADHLYQAKGWREKSYPLERLAWALGVPDDYVQALYDAIDEGVSPEEMEEFRKVLVRSEGAPACSVYAAKLAHVGDRLELLDQQTDERTGKIGRVRSIAVQWGEPHFHEIDIEWEAGGSSLLKVPPERLRLVEE